jgi:hypothetical protein
MTVEGGGNAVLQQQKMWSTKHYRVGVDNTTRSKPRFRFEERRKLRVFAFEFLGGES